MRVFVLGANGLVGRAIVRNLKQNGLGEPIAGVRRRASYFDDFGIESRVVNATDSISLTSALKDITHVINCVMGSASTMTDGMRNLCAVSRRAGIERLVHFSSCVVYGGKTGTIDEATPIGSDVNWYGAAKVECETIGGEYIEKGLPIAVLRPSCIYGPGSELWSGRVGRMLAAHRLGDLGALGDGRCNLVHVEDVAKAAVGALRASLTNGHAFNLSNSEPLRWNKYFMRYARAIGAIPVRRIPNWQIKLEKILGPALKVAQIAADKLPMSTGKIPDPLTPSFLRDCKLDVTYDGRKAAATFGISYMPLEEGLDQTARWFRSL
jgi:nucleoside-diphosphate-sugar epimerase